MQYRADGARAWLQWSSEKLAQAIVVVQRVQHLAGVAAKSQRVYSQQRSAQQAREGDGVELAPQPRQQTKGG